MKNGYFVPYIFITWMLQNFIDCQIVLNETFQQYNTSPNGLAYFAFNGTWYRQDVNKSTGVFKIRGPNSTFPTKYLSVYSQGTTSVTCIDLSLSIGSLYRLTYDYSWEWTSNFTVKWNNVTILNVITGIPASGTFVNQVQQLPPPTVAVNTLCFSGYNVSTGNRLGPVVDNIVVQCHGNSTQQVIVSNTSSVNSSLNSSSNSTTNSPALNNSSISVGGNSSNESTTHGNISKDSQLDFIKVQWLKQFSLSFNSVLKLTSIFGFSYLISNLLNFWNVIVLYYFLELPSFLGAYRTEMLKLCTVSLQQGSLFSLLQKSSAHFNVNIPKQSYERVPASSTSWASFLELGFTSQIFPNNIEQYVSIFLCVIKIGILKLVIFLVRRYIACVASILYGVKIKNVQIFLYEISSSSPTMVIVLGIMLSQSSSIAYSTFQQKINNLFQVITVVIIKIAIIVPILIEYRNKKIARPVEQQFKSTIFVESQRETPCQNFQKQSICFEDEQKSQKKATNLQRITTKSKQRMIYLRKLKNYKKQVAYSEFTYWCYTIEIFDKVLFITIPILIGLRVLQLFFVVNLIVIIFSLGIIIKKGHYIRQFNAKQFWFGFVIKMLFLILHCSFICLYFQDKGIINLSPAGILILSFIIIVIVIMDALIETAHCFVNVVKWSIQLIKKIKMAKATKFISNDETVKSGTKKNLQLIHVRKDTEADLQPKLGNDEQYEVPQSKCNMRARNIGRNTQRISTVMFAATHSETETGNEPNDVP